MSYWAIMYIRDLFGANEFRRKSWPIGKIYKIRVNPSEPIVFLTDEDLLANDWTLVFNNKKENASE